MRTDERDDRLGEVLDHAVRSATAPEQLVPVLRRGDHRRAFRWTAIAAALVVFVGALTWAALDLRGSRTKWSTYAGPNDTWHLSYPPGWYATKTASHCKSYGISGGVIVSNVDFRAHPQVSFGDCFGRIVLVGFPADGVAVAITPAVEEGGLTLGGFGREPDTAFPLSASQLVAEGIRRGPRESYLGITEGGETTDYVRTWIGKHATRSDLQSIDRVISSIDVPGAPRWVIRRGPGLQVSVPSNWHVSTKGALIISSIPAEFGGSVCGPYPAAIRRLGGAGVMIELVHVPGRVSGLPRRPYRFRPGAAESVERLQCSKHEFPLRSWRFEFQTQDDVGFAADVAVGGADPGYLRRTAFRILNSLRFGRR